jgi:nucleotide-binding universal stress UspA family protein
LSLKITNVKKILIPIDGSEYSVHAAELGLSIAKLLSAEVMIVYVIDTVVLDQEAKLTQHEDVERELKQNGERYISYVQSLSQKESVKVASMLARGRPFEEIVRIAKELGIDLIVMGTYGRRGAERILIGSQAQRVIEYATCPVLVVK